MGTFRHHLFFISLMNAATIYENKSGNFLSMFPCLQQQTAVIGITSCIFAQHLISFKRSKVPQREESRVYFTQYGKV